MNGEKQRVHLSSHRLRPESSWAVSGWSSLSMMLRFPQPARESPCRCRSVREVPSTYLLVLFVWLAGDRVDLGSTGWLGWTRRTFLMLLVGHWHSVDWGEQREQRCKWRWRTSFSTDRTDEGYASVQRLVEVAVGNRLKRNSKSGPCCFSSRVEIADFKYPARHNACVK